MTALQDDPGFGIYIHWPFCAQKCPYCDFNSHVRHGGWDETRFLAAYKHELSYVAQITNASSPPPCGEGKPRIVTSIFFGGGTPSLMKPDTVAAILDHIAALWPVDPDAEITLEANPGSVETARFAGYRAAGVNRVSVGVQSLRDEELRRLGRIHTAEEARAAIAVAAHTFDRFSFDLIYARPGETPEAWRSELTEALALAGDHLSLYQLTVEPDTPFAALHAAGKLAVPDPDTALALYEVTQELTEARGLPAYEISNHAAPGEESRHNLLYWRYGEYAGVGPGAHGRLVVGGRRYATVAERNPEAWAGRVECDGHGLAEFTPLTRAEQTDETLLMGLRLAEGLDLDRLARTGGVHIKKSTIAALEAQGLVEFAQTLTHHPTSSRRRPGPTQASTFSALSDKDDVTHPDDIRACIGPGLTPAAPPPRARIRATPRGRLVLNALVAELARAFEPATGEPVAAQPGLG